jgi:RNA polymerase sigma-70 factor, ECF subfamily
LPNYSQIMIVDLPEVELIEKLRSGDEKSFEYVFKTYYPSLAVFAKKYVYDLDLGKELVQDLFVKLYENHENLQINSSLKSYLFKSVQNKCLTHISQTQLRSKHLENVAVIERERELDGSDHMEQVQLEENIYNSISTLPDQCRRIFKMSRMEGLKNKEIAEELNISIRTVETQISKALKILRESLSKYMLILMVLIYLINNF